MKYLNRVRIYKSIKANSDSEAAIGKKYGLYWMQQSVRVNYNHALDYAIELCNKMNLPLLVYFGVTTEYEKANERHYTFMMEGLEEVVKSLEQCGIGFCVEAISPEKGVLSYVEDAAFLVMDKGYLRIQRQWRKEVVKQVLETELLGLYEVESDLIVPIEVASEKEEYAARTIRPKIHKHLEIYSHPYKSVEIHRKWSESDQISRLSSRIYKALDMNNWKEAIQRMSIDHEVKASSIYKGGYHHALRWLENFLESGLAEYKNSNTPAEDYTSKMSLYLHFGQISALEIYHRLRDYMHRHETISSESIGGYIEQLVIRRELAFNFCYYRSGYDQYETMTNVWAYETMAIHEQDQRPYIYDLETLENYKTHDMYWNAAMKEMVKTGYMHNYMRMYWCKKIIEWTISYKQAYEWSIYLNNKYFIDGRDPNSYVGVAWCFGIHDRGWTERPVFGKLRYMNENGLKRKFQMEKYIQRVNQMASGNKGEVDGNS